MRRCRGALHSTSLLPGISPLPLTRALPQPRTHTRLVLGMPRQPWRLQPHHMPGVPHLLPAPVMTRTPGLPWTHPLLEMPCLPQTLHVPQMACWMRTCMLTGTVHALRSPRVVRTCEVPRRAGVLRRRMPYVLRVLCYVLRMHRTLRMASSVTHLPCVLRVPCVLRMWVPHTLAMACCVLRRVARVLGTPGVALPACVLRTCCVVRMLCVLGTFHTPRSACGQRRLPDAMCLPILPQMACTLREACVLHMSHEMRMARQRRELWPPHMLCMLWVSTMQQAFPQPWSPLMLRTRIAPHLPCMLRTLHVRTMTCALKGTTRALRTPRMLGRPRPFSTA